MKSATTSLSTQRKAEIDKYHHDFEDLIHLMYMDSAWTERYGRQKMLRVMTYCIYYRIITISHLQATGITPSAEPGTEKTFLNRLARKGFLMPRKIETAGIRCNLYAITLKGAKWCCDSLRALNGAENAPPLSDACLDYMLDRVRAWNNSGNGNGAHAIGIRDLNAYLLSYLKMPGYRYAIEANINMQGKICSIAEYAAGSIRRNRNSLQSDAILTVPGIGTYYMELDMNTQRAGVISSKLSNYIYNVWETHPEETGSHNILFSLTSRPQKASYTYSGDKSPSINSHAAYIYRQAICYAIYKLSDDSTGFYEVSMTDVHEEMNRYAENAPVSNGFYRNIAAYIEKFLAEIPGLTAEEFLETARKSEKESMRRQNNGNAARHRLAYISRKKAIQKTAASCKAATEAFLQGLSLYTTHTGHHDTAFPYLNIRMSRKKEERLILMLRFYGYIGAGDAFQYSALSQTAKMGYVLKNEYAFSNGFTCYVENISDDIGGYLRVQRHLDGICWEPGNGIIICLICEEDVQRARGLFCTSACCRLLNGQKRYAIPLSAYFITYQNLDTGRGLFTFDAEGNILSKSPWDSP